MGVSPVVDPAFSTGAGLKIKDFVQVGPIATP